MTKSLTRVETAAFLSDHDNYVILTHIRPDGDTLGSASALCLGLRSLGKTAHVLVNTGVGGRFRWMLEGLTVEEAGKDDTVISTDVASPGMLPDNAQGYLGRVRLRIDHHGSATSFSDLELVDPDSASCAEVVYDVLELMEAPRQAEVLDRIYVGLSTDTGCFRFANTTAHTFRVAAACAEGSPGVPAEPGAFRDQHPGQAADAGLDRGAYAPAALRHHGHLRHSPQRGAGAGGHQR